MRTTRRRRRRIHPGLVRFLIQDHNRRSGPEDQIDDRFQMLKVGVEVTPCTTGGCLGVRPIDVDALWTEFLVSRQTEQVLFDPALADSF